MFTAFCHHYPEFCLLVSDQPLDHRSTPSPDLDTDLDPTRRVVARSEPIARRSNLMRWLGPYLRLHCLEAAITRSTTELVRYPGIVVGGIPPNQKSYC